MKRVNANGVGIALVLLALTSGARGASQPPLRTTGGAVAADSEDASRIGAAILQKGGNAIDAAVATALTLGVVNPSSSGIGGGGFAIVYVAAEKKTYALDFREIAPAGLGPESFLVDGVLDPSLSRSGGLAVGVPGEVAGLEYLWSRHGSMKWRELVAPALGLAMEGFRVPWFFAHAARVARERYGADHPLVRWLSPRGRVIEHGQLIKRSSLAATLQRIADGGAKSFYEGAVASGLVATVRAAGGVLTEADLAGYKVEERTPLVGSWAGYEVVTMPLPSSGGLLLIEMLGILERGGFDLAKLGRLSVDTIHIVTEILKHGFADRARLFGDTDASARSAATFHEPARLASLAKKINLRRVKAHNSYGSSASNRPAPPDDGGTSHVCVVDRDGNAVALTSTINTNFGALLVDSSSGIVLNNEIDDFSLADGQANLFGLVQSELNRVGPGKRPLSSMTPVLMLKDGDVVGCFGGSGGPTIISNTFQVILNLFVHGLDAGSAVSVPRIHHQWKPNTLYVEDGFGPDLRKGLQKRGHEVQVRSARPSVQAVVRREGGVLEVASDPRKAGVPAVAN